MKQGKSQPQLSVENINPEIEIACKGNPQSIGNLQICRKGRYFPVSDDCKDYQHQKNSKPYKSEKIHSEIKENKAPYEVENETCGIYKKCIVCLHLVVFSLKPYKSRAYSHKSIKNCPHNREKKGGRGQRGSVNFSVYVHIVLCEKCRYSAYCKGYNNCDYKSQNGAFCLFFHKIIPFVFYYLYAKRAYLYKKSPEKIGRKFLLYRKLLAM